MENFLIDSKIKILNKTILKLFQVMKEINFETIEFFIYHINL